MKKILSLIVLLCISVASFGQTYTYSASGTVTNTTYAYSNTYTLGSGVGGKVSFQITALRTSGTTTGGIKLQYSNNGTSWTDVPSADTLAIANTATEQSKQFIIDIPAGRLIRARAQLAGTGVYTFKLWANYRYLGRP